MAKLADEHQGSDTTVVFSDFRGGLNTSQTPELIAQNELAKAINLEIDSTSGSLKTVAGTDTILSKTDFADGVRFSNLMYDAIGGNLLLTDTAYKVYVMSLSAEEKTLTEVGTLSGTGTVEYTVWEDGIVICSGGSLQYFHNGELETIENNFDTDKSYWTKLTPVAWAVSTDYKQYDVVSYKGELYYCTADHTSSTGEDTTYQERNLYYDSQYWSLALYSYWSYSHSYSLYDRIQYGGKVYYCNKAHTSCDRTTTVYGSFDADSQYWECIDGAKKYTYYWLGELWQYNTAYSAGNCVKNNGSLYRCKKDHTSCKEKETITNSFETDLPKYWIEVTTTEWANGTDYPAGALVSYNSKVYKCVTTHTSCASAAEVTITGLTETDSANWSLLNAGQWAYSTTYAANSYCYNGDDLYINNSFHTSCGEAPTKCHAPFIKNGRIYLAIGDELHCSGVGDEHNWTSNDNDASASQWLQIGYKDGGEIVGIGSLAADVVVFKDNNRAYHLAGSYPNWSLSEIGRQIDCKGFNDCVSLADQVLALGATTLQTIKVTDEYGDMRSANISAKVQKEIAEMGSIKMRYIPSLNQIWLLNGTSRFFFVDMNNGGFFQREYTTAAYDAVEALNNVYVLKADKLCRLNSKHMSDESAFLRWRFQGKTITTVNQFLVKRAWVDTVPYFEEYVESVFMVDKIPLLGAAPTWTQKIYHDYTKVYHSARYIYPQGAEIMNIDSEMLYKNTELLYGNDTKLKPYTLYRYYLRQIDRNNSIKLQGYGVDGPFLISNISYSVAEV